MLRTWLGLDSLVLLVVARAAPRPAPALQGDVEVPGQRELAARKAVLLPARRVAQPAQPAPALQRTNS